VHEWYQYGGFSLYDYIPQNSNKSWNLQTEGTILRKETVNRGSHQRNAASIRIANTSVACARELSRIEDFAKGRHLVECFQKNY